MANLAILIRYQKLRRLQEHVWDLLILSQRNLVTRNLEEEEESKELSAQGVNLLRHSGDGVGHKSFGCVRRCRLGRSDPSSF